MIGADSFSIPGAREAPCVVCERMTAFRVHTKNDGFAPVCANGCIHGWPKVALLMEYIDRIEKYVERGDFDIAQGAVRRMKEWRLANEEALLRTPTERVPCGAR